MEDARPICEICKDHTTTIFNIKFKPHSVCDSCALAITQQEVASWKPKTDGMFLFQEGADEA